MTGHRALEKKQITQGNNRKVQNPSGSLEKKESYNFVTLFFLLAIKLEFFFYVSILHFVNCIFLLSRIVYLLSGICMNEDTRGK